MAKSQSVSGENVAHATHDDIKAILGEIDPAKLLAIIELRPTIAEVEAASLWLAGDTDVFGAAEPLKGAASDCHDPHRNG